jgi:hypothetical protein
MKLRFQPDFFACGISVRVRCLAAANGQAGSRRRRINKRTVRKGHCSRSTAL